MPFYLFQGRFTPQALKAMVDKPHDREAAARPLIEAVGGKLHHVFFCMGTEDVVALIEAPDDHAMGACAMVVGASGTMSGGRTTKLFSCAEAMEMMSAAQGAEKSYTPATG